MNKIKEWSKVTLNKNHTTCLAIAGTKEKDIDTMVEGDVDTLAQMIAVAASHNARVYAAVTGATYILLRQPRKVIE